ncbi:MAG: glyceraldehyde-3-phosphate dehydrogenase [Actinomycetota bacterium]|nr:glyceraldehyde-3-phosphate dehydrogenase [Actinomycetota bacterium]
MGFGRIGRNVFRLLQPHQDIQVEAIVDTADPEGLTYLLRYDTIHRRFPDPVRLVDSTLYVRGHPIPVIKAGQPGGVDWGELGVDIVVEATGGKYKSAAWCQKHLDAGARRVILAHTPEKLDDMDVLVMGVNDHVLGAGDRMVSLGSNTSNAVAPILKILDDAYGVERAFFTTVHAFTNEQRLADVPAEALRSSRSAPQNIIPSETNSSEIIEHVLPELRGKISGMALNVPVPDGSTVDLVVLLRRPVNETRVNEVVRSAAESRFPNIVEYSDDPLVSSDVIGNPHSAIFDGLATMVIDGTMAKVIIWFDNGWGYAARVVELIKMLAAFERSEQEVRA